MVTLAEILRRHWPAYEAKHQNRLLPSHRRAVAAILRCRTPALGGQVYQCGNCGDTHFAYHSCHHRACPQCGAREATHWIARQQAKLLPVPYFLITFTVPEQLRDLIRSEQKLWYGLLFAETSGSLQDVASNPKYLGADLGFLGVLQTWTRDLRYHPHVHFLVPAAGLRSDGLRWIRPPDPSFFLPQTVLAARLRSRLCQTLRTAHPALFASIPSKVWRLRWKADVQGVGSGVSALKYLAAYVTKTAITSSRLLACDDHTVTFSWRESSTKAWRTTRLLAEAFLHLFLQHILPKGFQRVRYFGWLSPASKLRWQRILALLDWRAPAVPPPEPVPVPECSRCHLPMLLIGLLPRPPP